MIIGIGTDILNITRISKIIKRYDQKFIDRVYGKNEIKIVQNKLKTSDNYFAKRFAAKEAFAKALGTGFRGDVNVKSIIVINNELGRPDIKLDENVARLLKEKKIKSCHLSISDEKNIAAAFVVLESE